MGLGAALTLWLGLRSRPSKLRLGKITAAPPAPALSSPTATILRVAFVVALIAWTRFGVTSGSLRIVALFRLRGKRFGCLLGFRLGLAGWRSLLAGPQPTRVFC